jgi:hypothetical protein
VGRASGDRVSDLFLVDWFSLDETGSKQIESRSYRSANNSLPAREAINWRASSAHSIK